MEEPLGRFERDLTASALAAVKQCVRDAKTQIQDMFDRADDVKARGLAEVAEARASWEAGMWVWTWVVWWSGL